MKTYIIFTDLHIDSPIESMSLDNMVSRQMYYDKLGYSTVYLGDNIELVNTKDLKSTYNKYEFCKSLNWTVFLNGNHDHDGVIIEQYKVDGGILFIHSDSIKWGIGRSMKYRSQPMGKRKWWKFDWLLKFNDWVRHKTSVGSVTDEYVDKASYLAVSNDCHTIVMGHTHPIKLCDISHKGIRVLVCPRGITRLEL